MEPSVVARNAVGMIGVVDPVSGFVVEDDEESAAAAVIGTMEFTTSPNSISEVTSSLRRSSSVTPFSLRRRTRRLPSISATSHSWVDRVATAEDQRVEKWRATSINESDSPVPGGAGV